MTAWLRAAGVRAIRTFAQVLAGLIGANTIGITDVDWPGALSIAALAAVVSILTSLGGLPEVEQAPGRHAAP